MNYIKHLTGFFEKVAADKNLNPTHVSLYIALFQFWNFNRFRNPISISRDEVMRISKISSKATYHKCLKNLHNSGYINYLPSYNPFKGSEVTMLDFSSDLKPSNKQAKSKVEPISELPIEQALNKPNTTNKTSSKQALVPYINNTNNSKELNVENVVAPSPKFNYQFQNNFNSQIQNLAYNVSVSEIYPIQKEKSCAKKEKDYSSPFNTEDSKFQNIIPPPYEELIDFFKKSNAPLIEAQKFYDHYEANGWLVGGKSKMKNWHAAARNWLLNTKKFNEQHLPTPQSSNRPKPNNLQATTNKNYKEPL